MPDRSRLRSRLGAALLVAFSFVAACSGGDDVYEIPPVEGEQAAEGPAEEQVQLPPPTPAVPVFALRKPGGFTAAELKRLKKVDGAAVTAPLKVRRVKVQGPKATVRLRVAALDPIEFRSVAPPSTRSADFVWLSLLGGDAVVTHKTAKKIGIKDAVEVDVGSVGKVRIGAVADNGTPNLADVIVAGVGVEDWDDTTTVVVGAETGANLTKLREGVRSKVKKANVIRLIPKTETVVPQVQQPSGTVQMQVPTVAGMHPTLAAAVQQVIAASGGRVWLVSGYRDPQRQYQLWLGALEKYGDPEIADNWVARPGHSMHEAGLAADLGGDLDLAARLVTKLGLPLWRPMSWEPWHFELVGSR